MRKILLLISHFPVYLPPDDFQLIFFRAVIVVGDFDNRGVIIASVRLLNHSNISATFVFNRIDRNIARRKPGSKAENAVAVVLTGECVDCDVFALNDKLNFAVNHSAPESAPNDVAVTIAVTIAIAIAVTITVTAAEFAVDVVNRIFRIAPEIAVRAVTGRAARQIGKNRGGVAQTGGTIAVADHLLEKSGARV